MHSYDVQTEAPFSLIFSIITLSTLKLFSMPRSLCQLNTSAVSIFAEK